MKKVVIIGPECTGKSTLTQALAKHFKASFINEYAREYIDQLERDYNELDILTIAKGQIQLEDSHSTNSNFLFLDTDLLVCKVWSEFKYGRCHPWIVEQIEQRHYDHYLLCNIDLPWHDDGQREHPNHRRELFDIYQNELKKYNKSYSIISGPDRFKFSLNLLQSKLLK